MVQRRLPRWDEISPLIGRRDPSLSRLQHRLERCASIGDIRALARRRVPPAVFDYVDGAAGTETTLRRSRQAYARVQFNPRVLRDVSAVDLSRDLLGRRSELPFAFAPTGFTRMMHHVGEPAVATVAAEAGIPYALSTFGTTSVEDLAAAAPTARRWFQLYVWRDRRGTADLVERVAAAGYDTLILTVDTPVGRDPAAGRPQRPHHPAAAQCPNAGSDGAVPALVGQPADHRAVGVRLALLDRGECG